MKKISVILISGLIILLLFIVSPISVSAHSTTLDVEYDDCIPDDYVNGSDIGDGYNEKWYELVKGGVARHIPHVSSGVTEIKYYYIYQVIKQVLIRYLTMKYMMKMIL